MTLWVAHWSAPGLVHTTLLIHSSHSLVHTLVTSHVATISSTSSHHLPLSFDFPMQGFRPNFLVVVPM